MHLQVLASGSGGNATLLRAGELHLLVDAGLGPRAMRERLAAAGLAHRGLDHLLITHGHLDHARSAGALARQHDATVHCPAAILEHRSVRRAPRLVALAIGRDREVRGPSGTVVRYRPAALPHDCDPTVAFRIEHEGRVAAVLTDLGRPCPRAARALAGAHLIVIEFNHDAALLAEGPYPEALKRRVASDRGHLSNEQAAVMLGALAGPELHTVVLAHLSARNNTPARAVATARGALERLGLGHVRVFVAGQDEIGPNLKV